MTVITVANSIENIHLCSVKAKAWVSCGYRLAMHCNALHVDVLVLYTWGAVCI